MKTKAHAMDKQLYLLVFTSLLTDSFIQPFGRQNPVYAARISVLSGALSLLLLAGVIGLYLLGARRRPMNPLCRALLGLGLLFSIALEVIQGERFYSYVMDQELALPLFLGLAFIAAFYGVYSGIPTLGRTAWALLALTGVSVVILAASVSGQLRFFNLQTPPLEWSGLLKATARQFYLPPELLLLPLFAEKTPSAKPTGRVLFILFAMNSFLTILGEMALGPAYAQQELPVFTIARLGGISVFRRLDATHVSIWLLLFLLKIALYFAGFVQLWHQSVHWGNRHTPYWVAIGAVLILFMAAWNQNEGWALYIQQALLAAVVVTIWFGKRGKKA